MTGFGRARVLAVLAVMMGSGVASAQTVVVMNAPAGATVELALNDRTVGSATADAMGDATLRVEGAQSADMDARLFVEACGSVRRVRLQAAAVPLPAQGACTRQDAGSLFSVRSITSFVVDVGGSTPLVRVRQGPIPSIWVMRVPPGTELPSRDWDLPAPALTLSAGGGLFSALQLLEPQCGDIENCKRGRYKPVYGAGATIWLARMIGIQGSYTRSVSVGAEGAGSNFQFTSGTRVEMMNLAANLAAPIQVARLYGIGGMTFHRATTTMTQTIATTSTSVAGTQAFSLKTEGWGLLFGGGLEVWATPRLAIYTEVTRTVLKGKDVSGGEARVDVPTAVGVLGFRLNLFR